MRYLGNKTRLLNFIDEVIEKYNIKGKTFADLFAGTASVGDYFKDQYKIIGNDFMYYSYVFTKAKISNNDIPSFKKFSKKYNKNIFNWLNDRKYIPNDDFFIYNNYTPKGKRQFFTEENAIKIDGMRMDIEELYNDGIILENEYFFILASLLESVTRVSNTSGTYEAFFKFWDSRAFKKFEIEPLEMNKSLSVDVNNEAFNEDTNDLIKKISGDIAYIDTPYTITQYASAYHILETIARYDYPEIAGKTGRRQKGRRMSEYSRKKKAKDSFEDMFRKLNFKHVLISYSNQSLVPIDELIDLASKFAVNKKVYVETLAYREYRNLNTSQKRAGKKLHEVIIYFQKNTEFIKSPLNYSGSKDTMLRPIFNELPKHVGTFVDAMGGAFNVGGNVTALDKVVYNEYNSYIFNIIKMLMNSNRNKLIKNIEEIIAKYNLGRSKKEEYIKFRYEYNFVNKTPLNLFILHMFSFQNLIRFNSRMEFNTPVGNASYNDTLKYRIMNFSPHSPSLELKCGSFDEIDVSKYDKDTVFYFDPPYLITTAEYNDGKRGMKGWNIDTEKELLSYIEKIDKLGYKFMLSNVIKHRGKTNELLKKWVEKHGYTIINVGKTGTRYPRIEVLIKNY